MRGQERHPADLAQVDADEVSGARPVAGVGRDVPGGLRRFLGLGIDDLDALVGEQAHDVVEGVGGEICGIECGRDVSCRYGAALSGPCDQLRHLFR